MRNIVLLLICLSFTTVSLAKKKKKEMNQTDSLVVQTPEEVANKATLALNETLSLTPEQITLVKALNLKAAKEVATETEIEKTKKSARERASEIKNNEYEMQLRSFLSDTQWEHYQMMKEIEKKRDSKTQHNNPDWDSQGPNRGGYGRGYGGSQGYGRGYGGQRY